MDQDCTNDKMLKTKENMIANLSKGSNIALPPHWFLKQSRRRKGRIYYANAALKTVSWELPSFSPCTSICQLCRKYQSELDNESDLNKTIKILSKISNESVDSTPSLHGIKQNNSTMTVISEKRISTVSKFIDSFQGIEKLDCLNMDKKKKHSLIKTDKAAPKKLPMIRKRKCNNILLPKASQFSEESSEEVTPRKVMVKNDSIIRKKKVGVNMPRTLSNGTLSKWDVTPNNKCKITSKIPRDVSSKLLNSLGVFHKSSTKTVDKIKSPIFSKNSTASNEEINRTSDVSCKENNDKTLEISNSQNISPVVESSKPTTESESLSTSNSSIDISLNLKIVKEQTSLVAKRTIFTPKPMERSSTLKKQSIVVNQIKLSSSSEENCGGLNKQLNVKDSDLHGVDNDSFDAMEVDIVTELQNIRKTVASVAVNISNFSPTHLEDQTVSPEDHNVFVVVDTNILISHLAILTQISRSKPLFEGNLICIIVVPYTVLVELDGLKNRATVEERARAAIRWCNTAFSQPDSNVLGQSYQNYNQLRDTMHGAVSNIMLVSVHKHVIKIHNLYYIC